MVEQKDKILLRELEKNAKLSSRKLAMRTGLPISTVHRRVKKLEQEKVIKGYRALVDHEKIGLPFTSLIFINLAESLPKEGYVPISKIKEELMKLPEVYEILDVKGSNYDLVLKTRFSNSKEVTAFMEKLRNTKGIEEVSSVMVTEEIII